MATSGKNETSQSASAVAELLPDPTHAPGDAAPQSADDLIASIADQQIDALIGESDVAPRDPALPGVAAELAVQATEELQQMAQKLSDEARADLVADLNGAATEAMLTPIPQADPAHDDPQNPPPIPAATTNEVSVTAAAAAIAPPEPPVSAETAIHRLAPAPSLGTGPLPSPADTEVNQAEIDALINRSSTAVEAVPGPTPAPAEARSPVTAEEAALLAGPAESNAEAVARELADDLHHTATSLPPIVVVPFATRVRETLTDALLTVLGWINWPVRGLGDGAREVMGIIAIVTLVNAMSLLLYLMIFR